MKHIKDKMEKSLCFSIFCIYYICITNKKNQRKMLKNDLFSGIIILVYYKKGK